MSFCLLKSILAKNSTLLILKNKILIVQQQHRMEFIGTFQWMQMPIFSTSLTTLQFWHSLLIKSARCNAIDIVKNQHFLFYNFINHPQYTQRKENISEILWRFYFSFQRPKYFFMHQFQYKNGRALQKTCNLNMQFLPIQRAKNEEKVDNQNLRHYKHYTIHTIMCQP